MRVAKFKSIIRKIQANKRKILKTSQKRQTKKDVFSKACKKDAKKVKKAKK